MADVGKKTGKQTQAGRDVYETTEGEMVSEKSTTIEYKGKWINIPTIHGGKQYSENELVEMLNKDLIEPTSVHNELEEAIEAAQSRSNSLEFNKGGTTMKDQMELFEDGGLKDEGGMVDEESGNEVPVGGTRKGVRDDIPANISEGEFIFPEDVTRYIGLDKLMQLRQEAKMGLKRMEAMGQMGNSDEATIDDDLPFGMADLIIVGAGPEDSEELHMAEGGLTTTATGSGRTVAQTVPTQTTPVTTGQTITRRLTPEPTAVTNAPVNFKKLMGDASIEYKEYRNAAGESMMIPIVGGVPQFPVPEGYTLYTGTDAVENTNTTAGAIVRAANTATAEARAASMGSDNDTPPPMPTAKAINWSGLSTKELIERSAELTGTGSTIAKGAMAFLGPIGAIGYAMMRHQEKKVAAEIASRLAKGGLTAAQKKSLTELQEKLAPAKVTTLFGKVIEFVGSALGLTGTDVEAAKKNTGALEKTSDLPVAGTTAAPIRTEMKVIADATAMVPELGEIGPISSVSTANMAADLAEEGRAYDQSVEASTLMYRDMLMGKPLPSGLTEERITNNIIERLGVDALREIQSSIRPDMPSPYAKLPRPALQRVNKELDRMSDTVYDDGLPSEREYFESLRLSEPGSQMTTEEQIQKRKDLASNYQIPQIQLDPRSPTVDQPPIAPIGATPTAFTDQPPISGPLQYDMFGNQKSSIASRKEADKELLDSSEDANTKVLFNQVEKLLSEGSQREPLSDVDPNLQLESAPSFAPKLSAVPQSTSQPSGPFLNIPRNLGRGTTLEEAQLAAMEKGYVPPPSVDVVPPSPVTNLDLRPQAKPATISQPTSSGQTNPNIFRVDTGAPRVDTSSLAGISAASGPDAFDPRNLGGSEGYGSIAQQTQQAFDTSVYTQPSSMSLPTPSVDTSVYTQPSSMSLTPPTTPRTFNEEFAAQRKAGAKEFSYDRDGDGKTERYTTQTVEEAAPAGTNTFVQSAKNLLTPFDNKEYVGGKLVTTKKDRDTSKSTSKAKAPSAKVKNQVATSSGNKVTVETKPSSNKTEGAVSAGGQYAGDGFEWVAKKNADGTPALNKNGGKQLTRTYTGVNKNTTGSNDTSSASSSGSDKSIVCTEMYRQTQLADWQQAMKIWHVYQEKHLTMYHQVGYHWLFQPYVRGMKNSSVLTKIGSKLAKHRTQHLRHILTKGKAKDDLLGNVWCKFIHPLVYVAGVIKEKIGK